MSRRFDVAVIGGGPAGCIVSMLLARRGLRIALIDRAREGSHARAGETLPPEIHPLFTSLGLSDPLRRLDPIESPGIVSAWGSPLAQHEDFLRKPHGSGLHVDRHRLDSMLRQCAEDSGVRWIHCRVAACSRSGGLWRIVCDGEVRARFIVDATGNSGLRIDGADQGRREIDLLLAIAIEVDAPSHSDLRAYVESGPNGWWYSAPMPRGRMSVMFFTDPEFYLQNGVILGEELETSPLTRARLRDARILTTGVLRAPTHLSHSIAGPHFLRVGDSASAFDPLAGQGIYKALQLARNAATAVADALNGNSAAPPAYASLVEKSHAAFRSECSSLYHAERRWSAHPFWTNRCAAYTQRAQARAHAI